MPSPAVRRRLAPGDVLALLAHRYPFLLVDTIDVVEPGRRVVGTKRVTGGEWSAALPTMAMPGLLVVEALAQASAALLVDLLDDAAGAVGYFAGLQRVRLRDPARPGDTPRLTVELRAFRRGVAWLRGAADVDGRVVATADFTTVVRGTR
jgi:3-hydroxyacyl-[acyl-carrier-protein] dehydratase